MISVDVLEAIANELADENYLNRTHGRRSGVNAGCTGPLCQKFNRDRSRELYRKNNPQVRRIRRGSRTTQLDEFLEMITASHVELRERALEESRAS